MNGAVEGAVGGADAAEVAPGRRSEAWRLNSGGEFSFLPSGGETGRLVRGTDWSCHPLGPVESWPDSLKTTLSIVYSTRHPMALWWGPELYQFYNDAFMPWLDEEKHPQALGQRCADCWPEAWDTVGPLIRKSLESGQASWFEDHLIPIKRAGKVSDAYWTFGYSPVYEANGAIVGVLSVVTETTDKVLALRDLRRAGEELERAQQQMRSFMMQAPVGLAVLEGPQHVYALLNPVFRAMCFRRRPESDFLGKSVREALPELKGQGFYELLDGVYRTGKTFRGSKMRACMRQANGEEREMFINFTYQARRDEAGKIDGILAVVYEVTDQVNEQREIESLADHLRKAILSRDTFLGIASHELNTPLTGLVLRADLVARQLARGDADAVPRERVQRFVHDVRMHAKRLDRLIRDMLDASRINTGKFSMLCEEADLSALVDEILDRFALQCEAAGCALERAIAPRLRARVDPTRIEQVVDNLLVNALKYAPRSRLHVTLDGQAGRNLLAVRDEGPGIAAKDQERIFARFERAHSANDVSGLGLGLYISHQIVEAHGGTLTVHSDLGQGATFCVELPSC